MHVNHLLRHGPDVMSVQNAYSITLFTEKEKGGGAARETGHNVICFVTSYGVERSQQPPSVVFRLYEGRNSHHQEVSTTFCYFQKSPDNCAAKHGLIRKLHCAG